LLLAVEYFKLLRIQNPYNTAVDYAATEKVMGDVIGASKQKSFAVHINGELAFVLSDPENESHKNRVRSLLGDKVKFAIISDEEFAIINRYKLLPRAVYEQANRIKKTSAAQTPTATHKADIESYTNKLLDMMIHAALDRRASDLHLQKINDEKARILLRVDGKIYHFSDVSADVLPNLRNILKSKAKVGGENNDKPVEGQIEVEHDGVKIFIRVNIIHTTNGYDFCLRFLDTHLKELDELGLSDINYKHYLRLLHMTKGLVILCGPTGSGKTSLLYAGFKQIQSEGERLIETVEDPVEIKMTGITQMDIKDEKDMKYEDAIPSILRHDPDVIGVGEIRTMEVGMEAIRASDTGHLVFTTLHANDSLGAISRLTNMGISPYIVGNVLAAVVAQRLIRRVCTECAEEYELPADHVWRKRYQLGDGKVILKKGCGCAACAGTGYKGRLAVDEFLMTTPEIRDVIQKNGTRTELETKLRETDFKTYIQDAIDKARAGITTFDEVDELYQDLI